MMSGFLSIIEPIFAFCLIINAILFIPQIINLYKTKNSESVSLITFLGLCLIQLISILYGAAKNDLYLVYGYAISLISCGTASVLIIKYRLNKLTILSRKSRKI